MLAAYHPVHVSMRLRNGVGNLREYQRSCIIEGAFHDAKRRHGMRVVHYSIQGNHLHLVVEADDRKTLARGMQALASTIARRLNRLVRRRGAVFVDRYFAHILKTPREVARAVRYVLSNLLHHLGLDYASDFYDPYSSAWFGHEPGDEAPIQPPRTWLLRVGWRRATP